MSLWWMQRTSRERALIISAGLALTLAMIWQLAVMPALAWRDAAREQYEGANATLNRITLIEDLARSGQPLAAPGERPGPGAVPGMVQALAAEAGLSSPDLKPLSGGDVKVSFNAVAPELYFRWVERVEAIPGLHISSAQLIGNADGSISSTTHLVLDGAQ